MPLEVSQQRDRHLQRKTAFSDSRCLLRAAELSLQAQVLAMLGWSLTFLIIAIIAGVLGFGGIAAGAAGIAKILFYVFLVIFVISLITGGLGRPRV